MIMIVMMLVFMLMMMMTTTPTMFIMMNLHHLQRFVPPDHPHKFLLTSPPHIISLYLNTLKPAPTLAAAINCTTSTIITTIIIIIIPPTQMLLRIPPIHPMTRCSCSRRPRTSFPPFFNLNPRRPSIPHNFTLALQLQVSQLRRNSRAA